MLILSPDDARPGMVLAAPVPQPNNPSQDLLKRGCVLDANVLARLKEHQVFSLYVEFPGLEELDRHLAPVGSATRRKVAELIHHTFDQVLRNPRHEPEFSTFYAAVKELILTLATQGSGPLYFDTTVASQPDHVRHSTSVTHLSLLLGLKLTNYLIRQRHRLPVSHARDIVNLGVAAMLHDIGKMRLSPTLAAFHADRPPADPGALAEWRDHTRLGYEFVKNGIEPSAAAAILHHHQAFDGSGFPNLTLPAGKVVRFAGTRIHIFARILAAADIYDRLATDTGNKTRRSNLETLHLLRSRHASRIDGVLIATLHTLAPPYIPGSIVTLSDASRAVVIRFPDDDPFRPTVRRLAADFSGMAAEELDLRLTPELTITHTGQTPTQGLATTPDVLKAFANNSTDQKTAA